MARTKNCLFRLDGDTVEVVFEYDAVLDRFFGRYPDFDEHPRITPSGRSWVNVTKDDCPHADETYGDCGSCEFFRSELPGDLIGICDHEDLVQVRKGNKYENKN